jgi:hypothetical protein
MYSAGSGKRWIGGSTQTAALDCGVSPIGEALPFPRMRPIHPGKPTRRLRVRKLLSLTALLLLVTPAPARAQGGPPLVTDDPDTPGPGYWEINLSAFLERRAGASTLEIPRLDANYGVGRRIQLKLESPWIRAADGGAIQTGPGNAVAGVKYRFIGQEGKMIAWSVYPQVEFNTSRASIRKGIVEDGPELLLPTELTVEMFHAEINGEVGRSLVADGAGFWFYGLSTEGHVLPRLELLAELHGERHASVPGELIANVGGRLKLTRQAILMLAAGHGVRGAAEDRPHLLFYAGLQFNLPGLYTFK